MFVILYLIDTFALLTSGTANHLEYALHLLIEKKSL